jgi:phenylalanine-4-hydroxylase
MAKARPTRAIDREVAHISAAQELASADSVSELAAEVLRRSDHAPAPLAGLPPTTMPTIPGHRVPEDLAQVLEPAFGRALPRTPRVASHSVEGTLGADTEPVEYYEYQHATWSRLLALQGELVKGRCCDEYAAGRKRVERFQQRIPNLCELDAWVREETGWRVVRADGYVTPATFFQFIANGCFPCMDQVRHEKEILYSPAPDMYHDIVGHLPMLCEPRFSDYYRLFGKAGSRARYFEQAQALDRIYWFTAEFGLVAADPAPVAYGAALLTGLSELITSRGKSVEREIFTIDAAINTDTDVQRPNDRLYITTNFDSLVTEFVAWARHERLL